MKRWMGLLMVATVFLVQPAQAAGKGEPGPVFASRVEFNDRPADLRLFHDLDLDVDGVFDGWARIHLVQEELDKLRRLGYRVRMLPQTVIPAPTGGATRDESGFQAIPTTYHTYETLTSELQSIADDNPDLVRLFSIGQSVNDRELWIVKISLNPDVEEDEPEVAYVAAMHGDEVVGKELCIELIHYLLENYGSDSRVTQLVDNNEIWILPSLNPDGTALNQRYNANGFDLNRSFPDWFSDPVNSPAGRQPEVQAMMAWTAAHTITLSANFHGGELVANYPWDNNPTGSSVPSPTDDPDDDAFHSVALSYAENNNPMYTNPAFSDGTTNGAAWYAISGGLQDFSYAWYGNFHVLMELSEVKWPSGSQLPGFWDDNLESMLSYFERAQEGVRGIVTDAATGAPLAAEIRLEANPFAVYTDPDRGDYHRIVLPGSYTMEVSAPGYFSQTIPIGVLAGPAVRYDVALESHPADLQPIAGRVEDGPSGNGSIDPGETVDLAVTLKNLGSMATSVTARLIPTGWFGDVIREQASYPDIANQHSAESEAPYYAIHVDPDVPTGHKIGFAVEWAAAQGQGVSEPFFLDVGGSSCESESAVDVPQSIVDYQTTTTDVDLSSAVLADEVRVTVDISHTYIGDLKVTLVSPSGTRVLLHDRSGGGADDIIGTYGVDLTPAEALSALAGEPAGGTWSLEVYDMAGGDNGTLNSWSIEGCGWPVEAATPEMRLRDLDMEPDGVALRWWPYPGIQSYRVYRSSAPSASAAFIDVTAEDRDASDTSFKDTSTEPLCYYLVTGVGSQGEGAKGHFGE